MNLLFRCRLRGVIRAGLLLVMFLTACCGADTDTEPDPQLEQHIDELVQQLGASEYRTRERAEMQLAELGVVAFEALHEATTNPDIEIKLRARHLAQRIRRRYLTQGVRANLVPLLAGYDDEPLQIRARKVELLRQRAAGEAVTALARLARFEEDELLSKQAALAIMQWEPLEEPQQQEARNREILEALGLSRRPAVQWLRGYVRATAEAASAIDDYASWVAAEKELVKMTSASSSREVVDELSRLAIDLMLRAGQGEAAAERMRTLVLEGVATPESVIRWVDWLLQRSAWDVVEELAAARQQVFANDSLLLYRLAEARKRAGRDEAAEEAANQAFAAKAGGLQNHLDSIRRGAVAQVAFRVENSVGDESASRFALARLLEDDRGQIDWAAREYRAAIDSAPATSPAALEPYIFLSEMLHDQLRDREAAECLQTIVAQIEEQEPVRKIFEELMGRDLPSTKSRMHFFFACHHEQQKEIDTQKEHLLTAIQADPTDADVLIAMYRLPKATAEWKTDVSSRIREAADNFRSEINNYRALLKESDNDLEKPTYRFELMRALNQFAWLVGNTEGDMEEAIRASRESLEMMPGDAGYLDTLARCYYGAGDYENAVKYQRQAVAGGPFEGQLQRQLELFERALAQSPP